MRVYHNSREEAYRSPFGAVRVGTEVTLQIDVYEEPEAQAMLRTWVDGVGEQRIPMERFLLKDRLRFSVRLRPENEELLWYSFLITCADGRTVGVGTREGSVGGEAVPWYDREPPSFQMTVYRERPVPDWYKNGIVYQIFPDRFNRDRNWRRRAEAALALHKNGPARAIVEDWYATPRYERGGDGHIVRWDFFGGSLKGIEEKLDYLADLGITALYLNPIFEAASNHRYDTGDYTRIDPMLGTEEDFESLVREAQKRGISLILDGVFNHTGCDSLYFNKYGNYPTRGAWQGEDSPYRSWYRFDRSQVGYESWWGVGDLPNVDESQESYRDFIYGEDGIVRRWLRKGARGWRLDVADELPDAFIAGIKTAMVEEKGSDALLLGEVWEDASNKVSYSQLRRYLLGEELDSAMNYPLRDAVESFILERLSAPELAERLLSLKENYPPEAFYGALNLMGSHDRLRVLTLLGGAPEEHTLLDNERAAYRLNEGQRGLAKGRLWLTVLLQMTLPGVPCIYYGDEAGLEGYSDPYNRAAFPWGREDRDCGTIYRNAISLRRMFPEFTLGTFEPFSRGDDVFGFVRRSGDEAAVVLVNHSRQHTCEVAVPRLGEAATELIGGRRVELGEREAVLTLGPMGSAVVYFHKRQRLAAPMEHGSGVLCHLTSLPAEKGESPLEKPGLRFIDYLAKNGQKYWQILPLNPTDAFGSPYAGTSAFAGNVRLLGLGEGELAEKRKAFRPAKAYLRFAEENADWLCPWAMFAALKARFGGARWQTWPEEYRRYGEALWQDKKLAAEAGKQVFAQYLFETSWEKIRQTANRQGIRIIGDMPLYVSADSADAWARPELFGLDGEGEPAVRAGIQPDWSNPDGQDWGNPVYNWALMAKDGYAWWLRRFERLMKLYDVVRLDHFLGFEGYWGIPKGKGAREGRWYFGPGAALFEAAYRKLGPLPFIAEDLGSVTPAVRGLLAKCGFMGMDIIQFSDTDPMEWYEPAEGKIAYSGTHDNATLAGWCAGRYPWREPREAADALLKRLFTSSAEIIIVPLQDVLGLGDEARMNVPGTTGRNWAWQAQKKDFLGRETCLKDLIKLSKGDDHHGKL